MFFNIISTITVIRSKKNIKIFVDKLRCFSRRNILILEIFSIITNNRINHTLYFKR